MKLYADELDENKKYEPIPSQQTVQDEFEKKYGELEIAKSLFYLIRRFGYSAPVDTYKQISNYELFNDKYKNIMLNVSINSYKPYITFYIEREHFKKIYEDNYFEPKREYYRNFYKYLVENEDNFETTVKNFNEYMLTFIKESIEVLGQQEDCEEDSVYISFKKIEDFETFIYQIPYFLNHLKYRHEEAYKSINDWVEPREEKFKNDNNAKKPNFYNTHECEDVKELKKQCEEIINEFLKPTYVRDVFYDIFGEFKGDLEQVETIEYYEEKRL